MRRDDAIRRRTRDARQDVTIRYLVIVQEGLVLLIDGPTLHLPGARGAGAGAARVGQVDALQRKGRRGSEGQVDALQ